MISAARERARRDIDHQREQRCIEEKREHAMRRDGAANRFRRDRNVGDLRSHADDEGKIDEVPIIRLALAREGEAAAFLTRLDVELVRVMQREDDVCERPRERDGHDREREMRRLVIVQSILSFVFNTTVLAFSINAAVGLF